jgi:hypothetical protein
MLANFTQTFTNVEKILLVLSQQKLFNNMQLYSF